MATFRTGLREREFTEARMKTRSSWIAALFAAAIVIVSAACSSASGAVPAAAGPVPEEPDITVAAIPAVDLAGLYIAQDRGLFARQGLHVRIEPIPSAQSVIADQLNGKVDISAGSYVAYIAAEAAGARCRILAQASILAPNTRALVVTAQSRVTTIAALAGKKIGVNGVNSIGTLLISSVLAEHGMSVHDVHFVPVQFPLLGQALKRHTIDVAWLPEPTASADAQSMGLQELADLDQGATAGFPVGWYVVTKAWAKKYPRTLAAFLDALRQGQQIADSNRTAVEQAMEKLPAPFTVSPVIAAVMSIETYPLTIAPDINRVRVQRVADEMLRFHMLTTKFQVSSMLGGL